MTDPVATRHPRMFWAFAVFFAAGTFGTAAWLLFVADQPTQTKLLRAASLIVVGVWLIARAWWKFMR